MRLEQIFIKQETVVKYRPDEFSSLTIFIDHFLVLLCNAKISPSSKDMSMLTIVCLRDLAKRMHVKALDCKISDRQPIKFRYRHREALAFLVAFAKHAPTDPYSRIVFESTRNILQQHYA